MKLNIPDLTVVGLCLLALAMSGIIVLSVGFCLFGHLFTP